MTFFETMRKTGYTFQKNITTIEITLLFWNCCRIETVCWGWCYRPLFEDYTYNVPGGCHRPANSHRCGPPLTQNCTADIGWNWFIVLVKSSLETVIANYVHLTTPDEESRWCLMSTRPKLEISMMTCRKMLFTRFHERCYDRSKTLKIINWITTWLILMSHNPSWCQTDLVFKWNAFWWRHI